MLITPFAPLIALGPLLPLALLLVPVAAPADGYREPHPDVVAIVDAPPTPAVRVASDGEHLLLLDRHAMPPLADMARPMLKLAGLRLDPAAGGRWQSIYYTQLRVRALEGERTTSVPIPAGTRLATASWSDDSRWLVYVLVTDSGSELRVAPAEAPTEARTVTHALNRVLAGWTWSPDGQGLWFFESPAERGAEPAPPVLPAGPAVEETDGRVSPLRTYQDLLANAYDESLFRYHATTQLVYFDLASGERREVGAPALYRDVTPAPDGQRLLVETLTGEMSYSLAYWGFAHTIEVRSTTGELVKTVADVPAAEGIPIGGVRLGPRSVRWLGNEPATLTWFEALDGGDPKREVEHRDRAVTWAAPFDAEPQELLRVEHRAQNLTAFAEPGRLGVSEYDRDRRWLRTQVHDLSDPDAAPLVIDDRSTRDRYGDPGALIWQRDDAGRYVPLQQGPWVFRSGGGASPEGVLPFLDRLNLETGETERLWRCAPESYERVVDVLPRDEGLWILTSHETPSSPPNYRLRKGPDSGAVAVTEFPDPTPSIRGISKELVTYEREDGVPLSATLYLPADHDGSPLPLLVWAYPREFNDVKTAGQVTTSPWRFTSISGASHLALVARGYAVLDGATMPVIGDAETMNDTFIEQIVGAAQAAIDFAVERGVADRQRVGVGGHSYGAFMTANLLAHCDLFAAGIARSGAYNRTLTPFGFQSERRTFWEAPDAYFALSPFMHADDINEPLLLLHGEDDNNSGTYPLQSQRLFAALQGNGGVARLVMLPYESHGYRARESVLHTLYEMESWLDRHLVHTAAREASAQSPDSEVAPSSDSGSR